VAVLAVDPVLPRPGVCYLIEKDAGNFIQKLDQCFIEYALSFQTVQVSCTLDMYLFDHCCTRVNSPYIMISFALTPPVHL
jgi:hypothetical protein